MAMSSQDIIHYMARDISQYIRPIVPDWPYPDEPGDAYTDDVCIVFGDEPTEQSVLQTFKSGQAAKALHQHLNGSWETDVVTEEMAAELVRRMIINNFGPAAVK